MGAQTISSANRDSIGRNTADGWHFPRQMVSKPCVSVRKYGIFDRIPDETASVAARVWLEQSLQDLRFAFRVLRRNPAYTAAIVLTLALGIGMNTAMFSVVNAVLLQPLPYPSPERLIYLTNRANGCNPDCSVGVDSMVSRADFVLWRTQAHSFEKMAAYGNEDVALVDADNSDTERIASITGDFWNIAGAKPALGHLFEPREPNALVLTWALFERRFNGNPAILGKTVRAGGYPFTIVGVLPKHFRFLFPQELWTGDELRDIDAFIPLRDAHETPGDPIRADPKLGPMPDWVRVVGRLNPNVPFSQAKAEMQGIFDRIARNYPSGFLHKYQGTPSPFRFVLLSERLVGGSRLALTILFGAVAFVLLIATANIANLLLARNSTRQRELAIRTALGAGRMRIIRQFLTESILLALLGGIAGLVLARYALILIIWIGSQAIPRIAETRIDGWVLGFTLAISLATGVLFGLAPASSFWRRNPDEVLNVRATSASASPLRLRGLLVSLELAMAIVLLSAAGLMLRSFWRMNDYPPGLAPERILVMKVSLSGEPYFKNWPQQDAYLNELSRRIASVPGVQAFGIDCGALNQPIDVEGVSSGSPNEQPAAALRAVTPGYFRVMGVPLTQGHWPTERETFDVVLVNQSLAWKTVGRGREIVGRHLRGSFLNATIAGVVADFRDWQLDEPPEPQVYMAYQRAPVVNTVRVVVRTSIDPKYVESAIRKLVSGIDRNVPVYQLQTLQQALFDSIAPRRFNMFLLETFAGTALLLALVGVYGVIAYSVVQRTREIGIRMALGAENDQIVGMVVRQGMRMALAGIAVGMLAALALTRLMASLLYDVKSNDPATFFIVALLLASTALLACFLPALKAARIDPMVALRYE
jgi:putative ABC transport system permease protein